MGAPKYPQSFQTASVHFATANTLRDGTGTIATLITGIAAGTAVQRVRIAATGNTTDNVIRLWKNDGSYRLLDEIRVPAITATAPLLVWRTVYKYPPGEELMLNGVGESMRVSTNNAEGYDACAEGQGF